MDMAALKQAAIQELSSSMLAAIGFIHKQAELGYEQLTFIRLDLSVKAAVPAEHVEDYLTHLRSAMRRRRGVFADCLGMVRTAPFVEAGQYRIECLLIFNGKQVQLHIPRGHNVGRFWVNIITEEQGSYCNLNQYRQLDSQSGLGHMLAPSMRWQYHQLIVAMGSADHPLIIAGVRRPRAKEPMRD